MIKMSTILTSSEIKEIRRDFPLLEQNIYDHPLVYLDNAATTQKPRQVLNQLERYYRQYNSNVHRGVHHLSQVATDAYEEARKTVAAYIDAGDDKEVIFTKGTTDGINLVASSFGRTFLQQGDSVMITAM